jgi:Protein of unknown function (DUF3485)
MKLHSWFLPILLAGSLSSIYFLPKVGAVAESAVDMELPVRSGSWSLTSIPPSEAEIGTLAPDTRFSKAVCLNERPGEFFDTGDPVRERLDLSIVLSGADINNSIHRPERCMPAQGHSITSDRSDMLKLGNGREFPVKRLLSIQTIQDQRVKDREVYLKFNCLTYYFFVGHDRVSNDHLGRTLVDMKDRLVRGMDQRWAYVSISMWYGKVPWIGQEVPEAEADAKLRAFLADFSERQIDWDQITR